MKRRIALLTVLCMTICLLAGCGGAKTEAPAEPVE